MDEKTKELLSAARDAIQYMNPIAQIDIKGQLIQAVKAFDEPTIAEDLKVVQKIIREEHSNSILGAVVYHAKDSLNTVFAFWRSHHT